jgi:hypothetical protein
MKKKILKNKIKYGGIKKIHCLDTKMKTFSSFSFLFLRGFLNDSNKIAKKNKNNNFSFYEALFHYLFPPCYATFAFTCKGRIRSLAAKDVKQTNK